MMGPAPWPRPLLEVSSSHKEGLIGHLIETRKLLQHIWARLSGYASLELREVFIRDSGPSLDLAQADLLSLAHEFPQAT